MNNDDLVIVYNNDVELLLKDAQTGKHVSIYNDKNQKAFKYAYNVVDWTGHTVMETNSAGVARQAALARLEQYRAQIGIT